MAGRFRAAGVPLKNSGRERKEPFSSRSATIGKLEARTEVERLCGILSEAIGDLARQKTLWEEGIQGLRKHDISAACPLPVRG